MSTTMIEATNLSKQYAGGYYAINDISFSCQTGEIVGFLGPNGAGKTTTMRILTGYMPPTSGVAKIAGFDTMSQSLEARQRLGYLPETVPLYPEMTVEAYLEFVGKVRRLDNLWDRIDEKLEAVGLLDRAESLISTLSKGMRQRVGLAQALLHDPDVLILDEPTIGLDPAQIREIRKLITDVGEKHTILLSTHILSEVEQICDRVIMVINGTVYADMPLKKSGLAEHEKTLSLSIAQSSAETLKTLQSIPNVSQVLEDRKNQYSLVVTNNYHTQQDIAEVVVKNGWGLVELTTTRTNLEAIFMDKLREAERESLQNSTNEEAMWEEEE